MVIFLYLNDTRRELVFVCLFFDCVVEKANVFVCIFDYVYQSASFFVCIWQCMKQSLYVCLHWLYREQCVSVVDSVCDKASIFLDSTERPSLMPMTTPMTMPDTQDYICGDPWTLGIVGPNTLDGGHLRAEKSCLEPATMPDAHDQICGDPWTWGGGGPTHYMVDI